MTERKRYLVTFERDSPWWFVRVPELGLFTQARWSSQVEQTARDLIATTLDVPPDSFDIDLARADA